MRTTANAMACALLALVAAQSVQAVESGESWLDEMATIEAQTQLLQKRDELRSQLEKSSAGTLAALPSIVTIMGVEGRYQSQVHFPNGRLSYVQVGDRISADVRVVRISANGVDVQVGEGTAQRTIALGFTTLEMRQGGVDRNDSTRPGLPGAILPDAPQVRVGSGE